MKVALLFGSNSRNSGGLYNSVRSLGQSLLKIDGVEPLALAHSDEYSSKDIAAYAPLPLEEYHIKGPSNFGYSPDLSSKLELLQPDIVHPQCIWMYSSYATLKYHKAHNKPHVISPRGMLDKWILNNNGWKKKIAAAVFENEHLKQASCLHALALPEYDAMRAYGCKNPIAVIPNGVHLPAEQWPADGVKPAWKTADDRKVLLFLSRLHPKKGIANMIQAWANAGNARKGWKLAIAGETRDKSYLDSLHEQIASLKLENEVFLIGPQFHREKDICFRCADAFILPSFSEGLPMAVLEAWSYKLPVIMTAACNIPEGFEKEAAFEILPEVDSIHAGLEKLFNMTGEERSVIGKNGFQLVKDKFIWSSIASQISDVYKWVLSGGPQPVTIKNT